MGSVVDVVGYACAWLALAVAGVLCLARAISLHRRRAPRLLAVEAGRTQPSAVRRSVVVSTTGIPTITVH